MKPPLMCDGGDGRLFREIWRSPSERQWETAGTTVVFANEQDVQED